MAQSLLCLGFMNTTTKQGTMADLLAALEAANSGAPRYMVRTMGNTAAEPTFHNTFRSVASAERYAAAMADLNPGVDFEVVDLETGKILGD